MKEKDNITVKVNKKLQELCLKYGVEPEQLFIQFQQDMLNEKSEQPFYPTVLAELYLTEYIASNSKVDRSSVESVLGYMRSNSNHQKTKQQLPQGLSKTTKKILKECNYRKKHSKN